MGVATESTPLRNTSAPRSCCDVAARVRALTSLASLAEGYDIGIINGALEAIKTDFGLSQAQVGIAVGMTPLLTAVFSLLAGSIADYCGRKPTIALSSCSLLFGNIVWALAPSLSVFLVARALQGVGIGLGIAGVTMYMSEVAPAEQRGFYASLEELFLSGGILLGYAACAALVGEENDWRIIGGMGAPPAAVVVVCFLSRIVPESPRFLKNSGRVEEAREVLLEVLRGDQAEVDNAAALWDQEARNGQITSSWYTALVAFCTTRRSMAIAGIGVAVMQMLGGIPVLTLFSSYILVSEGMQARLAIIITLVSAMGRMIVLGVVTTFLLDRVGRRLLLLLSAGISCVATATVAFAYYQDWGILWLVGGLFVWNAGFGLAMGPVTYVYLGEVFDNDLRAKGVSTGLFCSRFLIVFWGFSTPVIYQAMGIHGMFMMLAGLNLLAFLHFYTLAPETMGFTLEQISSHVFSNKASSA